MSLKKDEEINRLENIDVHLVSFVKAGANRQTQWLVRKENNSKDNGEKNSSKTANFLDYLDTSSEEVQKNILKTKKDNFNAARLSKLQEDNTKKQLSKISKERTTALNENALLKKEKKSLEEKLLTVEKQLNLQLKKTEEINKKLNNFKKFSIGASSVMPTGETTKNKKDEDNEEQKLAKKDKLLWSSGSDLNRNRGKNGNK